MILHPRRQAVDVLKPLPTWGFVSGGFVEIRFASDGAEAAAQSAGVITPNRWSAHTGAALLAVRQDADEHD